MAGFGSNLNGSNENVQHPSFEGWSLVEIEKYFSDLDDAELAPVIRERLEGSGQEINTISIEELAEMFGIDLDSLMPPAKFHRPAGFALPEAE